MHQRQLSWIVENKFDGVCVHFRAARMHVLSIGRRTTPRRSPRRPSLLLAVACDFLVNVFNPRFATLSKYDRVKFAFQAFVIALPAWVISIVLLT